MRRKRTKKRKRRLAEREAKEGGRPERELGGTGQGEEEREADAAGAGAAAGVAGAGEQQQPWAQQRAKQPTAPEDPAPASEAPTPFEDPARARAAALHASLYGPGARPTIEIKLAHTPSIEALAAAAEAAASSTTAPAPTSSSSCSGPSAAAQPPADTTTPSSAAGGGPPLRCTDIRDLLLWVAGDVSCVVSPAWVFVRNLPLVSTVAVVAIESLPAFVFERHAVLLAGSLGRPGVQSARFRAPGDRHRVFPSLDVFLSVPRKRPSARPPRASPAATTTAAATAAAAAAPTPPALVFGTENALPPPSFYRLSRKEMEENDYPLEPRGDSWFVLDRPPRRAAAAAATAAAGSPAGDGAPTPSPDDDDAGDEEDAIFAVDCEMCITSAGLELTRVSAVNRALEPLYDTLVLPTNPIIDYNTQYSGITAEMMQPVTKRLADVQADLRALLPATCTLVGHSLENDLAALHLVHQRVIDTALLYPRPGGSKSSLKWLTRKLLSRTIQEGAHDSVIDAAAAMELALLKIARGPDFGQGSLPANVETVFDVVKRTARNVPCTMLDRTDAVARYSAASPALSAVPCVSDEETGTRLVAFARLRRFQLVWATFRGFYDWIHSAPGPEPEPSVDSPVLVERLLALSSRLSAVMQALPPNALLVVLAYGTHNRHLAHLQTARSNPGWTDEMEGELLSYVERLREGRAFFWVS